VITARASNIDPTVIGAIIGAAVAVMLFVLAALASSWSRRRVVVRRLRCGKEAVSYYIINRGKDTHYVGASYVTIRVLRRRFWKVLQAKDLINGQVDHRQIGSNCSLHDAFGLYMIARRHGVHGRWVLLRARVTLESGHTSRSSLRLVRLPPERT